MSSQQLMLAQKKTADNSQAIVNQYRNIASSVFSGGGEEPDLFLKSSTAFIQALSFCQHGVCGNHDFRPLLKKWDAGLAKSNAVARYLRNTPGRKAQINIPEPRVLMGEREYDDCIAKSAMDVGNLTDLAAVTGGQALDYISMDFRLRRGTTRPKSATLFFMLGKSMANQTVDWYAYAPNTGNGLMGTTTASFASQSNTPNFYQGGYVLESVDLKLFLNARAITLALSATNQYVNIPEQEIANAYIGVLETVNYLCYYGNQTIYNTQFNGLAQLIPSQNVFNFQSYLAKPEVASAGLLNAQNLFNLIYEVAGFVAGYTNASGTTTHAMMSNATIADLQSLVTTRLNNVVNLENLKTHPLVVNGDFQGMATRFGDIHFTLDIFISGREAPAQAVVIEGTGGLNQAMASIAQPTSVVPASTLPTAVAGSQWSGPYVGSSTQYVYAVAATDANSNESVLTYSTVVGPVAAGDSVPLVITPNGATATAFRVYRSGEGYNATSGQNPDAFRLIGVIAANGSSAVTFTDLNTKIPGSETIFCLDLVEDHLALDYRCLLNFTRIDLFAQAFIMPFAIAHIGALRVGIPKFHAMITNYVPTNPTWDSLLPNTNASII